MKTFACPCQSGQIYQHCCQPLHQGQFAATALQLMRSRYSAFVLQQIDYIIKTTLPYQQPLLDIPAITAWSKETQWSGLEILNDKNQGKYHAIVEFKAHYLHHGQDEFHHEISAFVKIKQSWYFIDPTVPMNVSMKQPCICGSGKKFKHCCGQFL